jgi:serpin B
MGTIDGNAGFAAALHATLRSRAGNLFYSPTSVRIAMAMAAAGARGETATELNEALVLPPGDAAHAALGELLAAWDALATPPLRSPPSADAQMRKWQEDELARKRIVLRVVNRLWAQTGHEFRAEFLNVLRQHYRAPLGIVDFRHDAARVAINDWVADATEKKIKELIAATIPSDTKLVITNAVYFKAKWADPFDVAATTEQPFFVAAGQQVKVPLMRNVDHLSLARLDGAMMAELPYGEGRLVMDVVLPNARDGLAPIEAAYSGGAFATWVEALTPAYVDITLPRFRTSSSLNLAAQLSELGMRRAFGYPDADFSGMDGTHELFIGQVIHQAFVDVDEYGTEAAAATAMVARAGGRPPQPVIFRADHPFLFLIRDTHSGVVLFAGRLADPSATHG